MYLQYCGIQGEHAQIIELTFKMAHCFLVKYKRQKKNHYVLLPNCQVILKYGLVYQRKAVGYNS
jgi:hypothetical protein